MFYTFTKNYKDGINNLYVAKYYSGKYHLPLAQILKYGTNNKKIAKETTSVHLKRVRANENRYKGNRVFSGSSLKTVYH